MTGRGLEINFGRRGRLGGVGERSTAAFLLTGWTVQDTRVPAGHCTGRGSPPSSGNSKIPELRGLPLNPELRVLVLLYLLLSSGRVRLVSGVSGNLGTDEMKIAVAEPRDADRRKYSKRH